MFTLDLCKIKCAKASLESAKEASDKAKEALKPILQDLNLMADVLKYFTGFLSARSQTMNADKRKQFLFIIMYLFHPSALLGGAMPRGFRERLRNLLHVEAPTIISNNTNDLLFLYHHYRDFREGVNDAYSYIAEEMNIEDETGWWSEEDKRELR